MAPVTKPGMPPIINATPTVSAISASLAPAALARWAMPATPSGWARIASHSMVMRILTFRGKGAFSQNRFPHFGNVAEQRRSVFFKGGLPGGYLGLRHVLASSLMGTGSGYRRQRAAGWNDTKEEGRGQLTAKDEDSVPSAQLDICQGAAREESARNVYRAREIWFKPVQGGCNRPRTGTKTLPELDPTFTALTGLIACLLWRNGGTKRVVLPSVTRRTLGWNHHPTHLEHCPLPGSTVPLGPVPDSRGIAED